MITFAQIVEINCEHSLIILNHFCKTGHLFQTKETKIMSAMDEQIEVCFIYIYFFTMNCALFGMFGR